MRLLCRWQKLNSGRWRSRRSLLPLLALLLLLSGRVTALGAPASGGTAELPLNPPTIQAGETIRVTGRPMAGLSQYTLKKHEYSGVLVLIPADAQAWLKLQQAMDSAAFVALTVLVQEAGARTTLSVQDVAFGPYPADDPAMAPRNPPLTTPGDLVTVTGRISAQQGRYSLTDHRYSPNIVVLHPTAVLSASALDQAARSGERMAVTAVVAPSIATRQYDLLVRQLERDTGAAPTTPASAPGTARAPVPAPQAQTPGAPELSPDLPARSPISDSFWRWLLSLPWSQLLIHTRYLPWAGLLLLLPLLVGSARWLRRRGIIPRMSPHRFGLQGKPNVLPVLGDSGEEELYQLLQELTRGYPVTVLPKMRLPNAVPVSKLRLPRRLKQYGDQAHLAFTVVDGSTYLPLVAVELESGADRHAQWKSQICATARLPLIRVRYGRWADLEPLLQYLPGGPPQTVAASRQPEPPG